MTSLLNKIEMRLGMAFITLPEQIAKDKWPKVIEEASLPTFSRFFPHKIIVDIDTHKTKAGYYLIDDNICRNYKILGIGDIDWSRFARQAGAEQSMGYGAYDFLSNNYGLDDVGLLQMRADHMSMFDNGIYLDFELPNRIKLTTINNQDISRFLNTFPLEVYVQHHSDLSTISPTLMETFEDLAIADVAIFLYNNLKYFDGMDSVFANIDLKLQQLEEYANSRKDVVQILRDNYISAGNKHQHLIYVV